MILVDTSIWIEFFRKNSTVAISLELIPNIVVCPPVIQEVLQGIRDEAAFSRVKAAMLNFAVVGERLDASHYLEAASIFRAGQRRGITIRSSIDCLIAAIALRHDTEVWHKDRDFHTIAKFTELRQFNR